MEVAEADDEGADDAGADDAGADALMEADLVALGAWTCPSRI